MLTIYVLSYTKPRPRTPRSPWPQDGSSGQGRALCQTGYSVVCSRGVGPTVALAEHLPQIGNQNEL